MAHDHSFFGVLQGMIILTLFWWSWVSFSWLSNQTHVDEGVMRFGLSAVMVCMFIASLAIPEAFTDLDGGLSGPLVLALAYVVVRVLHVTLYAYAAGDDQPLRRQVAKTAVGMVLGSALIVGGAVIGGEMQTWFWLAGVAVDAGITYLTSTRGNWRVHSAAHWTERYGLVVILALGESIVAIGVGASQEPVSIPILAGAVFGVALSVCLWWLHFDVTAIAAEHRFAALHPSTASPPYMEVSAPPSPLMPTPTCTSPSSPASSSPRSGWRTSSRTSTRRRTSARSVLSPSWAAWPSISSAAPRSGGGWAVAGRSGVSVVLRCCCSSFPWPPR